MSARTLDIEVTRRCNLRCDYCFVGWSRNWTSDLPEDVAKTVIDEGAGRFPVLHLMGGEPFVYKPLLQLCERGLARGYEEVLVNTNGTFLSPEVVRSLSAFGERFSLTVSLDGPEVLHDRVRGAGRFAESSRGLWRALAAGIRCSVMVVVTPEVLKVLAPFLTSLMKEHPGLEGITLFPVGVGPAGTHKPGAVLRPLSMEEVREMALVVALLYRTGIPVGIAAYPMVNPILRSLGYPERRLYQCTAGRGRVCVHADQTVSTCHPVKEPVYGRWRAGLLSELDRFAEHARLAARDFDGCSECGHREECGHCRAYVTSSGAPFFGNDGVCVDLLPRASRRRLPVVAW